MFCPKCGNQLNEGATFCPKCGANVDAASEPRLQGTSSNSVNVTGIKKRKSTIIICIGFVLYVLTTCIPSQTLDILAWQEAGYELRGGSNGVITLPSISTYFVPVLIGLVELICAIKNKKAVFVLSIIQTVLSVLLYAIELMMLFDPERTGMVVSYSNIVYLPIVASVLLLVGGIMFRKENAISGGTR